jgi:hypothetical protein
MSALDMREALCVGRGRLFESTNINDHRAAAAICANCPVRLKCAALLRDVVSDATALWAGGRPVGTWAGQLVGVAGRRELPREHGTDRGYYQHRHRREDACAKCKKAHALTERKSA